MGRNVALDVDAVADSIVTANFTSFAGERIVSCAGTNNGDGSLLAMVVVLSNRKPVGSC